MEVLNYIVTHIDAIITAVNGLAGALIAICLLVPGPEPEATLQKIVDFLTKFSKKPKPPESESKEDRSV